MIGLLVLSMGMHFSSMRSPEMAPSTCPLMGEMKICDMTKTEYVRSFSGILLGLVLFFVLLFGERILNYAVKREYRPFILYIPPLVCPRIYA